MPFNSSENISTTDEIAPTSTGSSGDLPCAKSNADITDESHDSCEQLDVNFDELLKSLIDLLGRDEVRSGGLSKREIISKLNIRSDADYLQLRRMASERGDVSCLAGYYGGMKLIDTLEEIDKESNSQFDEELKEAIKIAEAETESTLPQGLSSQATADKDLEKRYYPRIENWAKQKFQFAVTIGDNHRRDEWENPDVIALNSHEFKYHIGRSIELVSIEVKLGFTIKGIWQAAQYRKFSNFVYIASVLSPDEIRNAKEGYLFQQAVDFGLGVISLNEKGSGLSISEINSPQRQYPNPVYVDQFLDSFSDKVDGFLDKAGSVILRQLNGAIFGR